MCGASWKAEEVRLSPICEALRDGSRHQKHVKSFMVGRKNWPRAHKLNLRPFPVFSINLCHMAFQICNFEKPVYIKDIVLCFHTIKVTCSHYIFKNGK